LPPSSFPLAQPWTRHREHAGSASGRRARQSAKPRDRRDQRKSRCSMPARAGRSTGSLFFANRPTHSSWAATRFSDAGNNDLTTHTEHLKDGSRGRTRGPMSKERLTSADATRPGYGLRGRLLLSFIAISSFAAIAAIVGTYALYTIGKALHEMTDRSI